MVLAAILGVVKRWGIVKISCILMFSTLFLPLNYTEAQVENDVDRWKAEKVAAGVVETPALYFFGLSLGGRFWHLEKDFRAGILFASLGDLLVTVVDGLNREALSGLSEAELKKVAYDNNVIYYVTDISALSEQVWAVSLETEPGGQGQLNQKIEAVCGNHSGVAVSGNENGFERHEAVDAWWSAESGRVYVGDYFTLEQFASTSGGLTRRFISVSSIWSLGFIHEDITVAGRAVVRDRFMMKSLEPGQACFSDWLEMF